MISRTACQRLAAELSAGASVRSLTPLAGGVSATVGLLELVKPEGESKRVVVRQHGAEHNGLDAATEARLLQALYAGGLKVPAVLLVDAEAQFLERPGLILEHISGTSEVTASALPGAIETMVQALLEVHRFPGSRLPALPRRLDPVPELFDWLPCEIRWTALRNWLSQQRGTAYRDEPKLLHGDFWPENLLWRDGELVAVLDWEDAAIGDPLSDVAGAGLELRFRHGRDGMQWFFDCYARRRPLDRARLALWLVHVSAATLQFMSDWGLPAPQEAAMRLEALATLEEAAAAVLVSP